MTVEQLRAALATAEDGVGVYVEFKGFVHEIQTVRLEWDLDTGEQPLFIIKPEPKP